MTLQPSKTDALYLAIANADTADDLWTIWSNELNAYGFDRCLYGFSFYTTPRTGHLGAETDFIIYSNHTKAYVEAYLKDLLLKDAPMVSWSMTHSGAMSWSQIARISAEINNPRALDVLETNKKFGVTAGYTVSFKSVSERGRGAISLCAPLNTDQSSVDVLWDKHGSAIISLCNMAHLKMLTLPLKLYNSRLLTPKQREVLEWVADGKTTSEIADIIGKSSTMIEKHLRNARNTLNVLTTAQAVLKAMQLNQLFLPEEE